MRNRFEGKNDEAWNRLFDELGILKCIEANGVFLISANQIKEYREPRLMTKFDHSVNLPRIFKDNGLSILPITRGDYAISHFKAYQTFEPMTAKVQKITLPSHLHSLSDISITSEQVAMNGALASGMIAQFMGEQIVVPTLSGRMGSGVFTFKILNSKSNAYQTLEVRNAQMEIDGAYEGRESLAIFEAKRELADDFLVRQLFYPFRAIGKKVSKPIRPIFMVYSNGLFHLNEFEFEEEDNYNSIRLVKQASYMLDEETITWRDIAELIARTKVEPEPALPFPQADDFSRVVNLCEILDTKPLNRNDITEHYAFDARQTNYYTDAARYLGLIEKSDRSNGIPAYALGELGKRILSLEFKQRQLAFAERILAHAAFHETMQMYMDGHRMPDKNEVVAAMRNAHLYGVASEATYERRASTVRSWVKWIADWLEA